MLGKVQGNIRDLYGSQAPSGYGNDGAEQTGAGSFHNMFQQECFDVEKEKLLEQMGSSPEEYKGYGADGLWNGSVQNLQAQGGRFVEQAGQKGKLDILGSVSEEKKDEITQNLLGNRNAPYSILANEEGEVTYNGVTFQCDFGKNRLCLGDVSNPDNCLSIPLEKGGFLVVNREQVDGLIQAIGMFSPEDVNRIMRAIAQDAKLKQIEYEIEDETSGEQVLEKKNEEPGGAKALGREKEGEHEPEK